MEQVLNLFIWSLTLLGVVEGILNFPLITRIKHALFQKKYTYYLIYFLSCKQCFSFWIALILANVYHSPTGTPFLDGFLGAGMYLLLASIIGVKMNSMQNLGGAEPQP